MTYYIPDDPQMSHLYAGKTLTRQDVESILNRHEIWKNGSSHVGMRAHFAYADLSGLDLTGLNFHMASFEYANLQNVNFSGCDISKSSFRHSNCTAANFSDTILDCSNFLYADLTETTFSPSCKLTCIGNGKQLKTINVCKFLVTYSSHYMTIGCMHHELDWWQSCTLSDIEEVYTNSDAAYLYSLIAVVLDFVNQAPCIATKIV